MSLTGNSIKDLETRGEQIIREESDVRRGSASAAARVQAARNSQKRIEMEMSLLSEDDDRAYSCLEQLLSDAENEEYAAMQELAEYERILEAVQDQKQDLASATQAYMASVSRQISQVQLTAASAQYGKRGIAALANTLSNAEQRANNLLAALGFSGTSVSGNSLVFAAPATGEYLSGFDATLESIVADSLPGAPNMDQEERRMAIGFLNTAYSEEILNVASALQGSHPDVAENAADLLGAISSRTRDALDRAENTPFPPDLPEGFPGLLMEVRDGFLDAANGCLKHSQKVATKGGKGSTSWSLEERLDNLDSSYQAALESLNMMTDNPHVWNSAPALRAIKAEAERTFAAYNEYRAAILAEFGRGEVSTDGGDDSLLPGVSLFSHQVASRHDPTDNKKQKDYWNSPEVRDLVKKNAQVTVGLFSQDYVSPERLESEVDNIGFVSYRTINRELGDRSDSVTLGYNDGENTLVAKDVKFNLDELAIAGADGSSTFVPSSSGVNLAFVTAMHELNHAVSANDTPELYKRGICVMPKYEESSFSNNEGPSFQDLTSLNESITEYFTFRSLGGGSRPMGGLYPGRYSLYTEGMKMVPFLERKVGLDCLKKAYYENRPELLQSKFKTDDWKALTEAFGRLASGDIGQEEVAFYTARVKKILS